MRNLITGLFLIGLLLIAGCSQRNLKTEEKTNSDFEEKEEVFCSDIDLAIEYDVLCYDDDVIHVQLVNRGKVDIEGIEVRIKRVGEMGYEWGNRFSTIESQSASYYPIKIEALKSLESRAFDFIMNAPLDRPPTHVRISPVIDIGEKIIICDSVTNGFMEISKC